MDIENSFDRALETRFSSDHPLIVAATGRTSIEVKQAMIFVVDTLDLAKLGAESVFGKQAKPEHAIFIYQSMVALLANKPPSYGFPVATGQEIEDSAELTELAIVVAHTLKRYQQDKECSSS